MADETAAPARGARHEPPSGMCAALTRVDVWAGVMFVAIGLLGLYLSRNLDVGTIVNMGTAYMPRLCCFALIGIGGFIAIVGLLKEGDGPLPAARSISWRSLALVPAAVFTFGFAVERVGLVLAILATVAVAGTAAAGQRVLNVAIAAVLLAAMCVGIFVWGLGLPFSIWLPDN
jgi:hypothetical protein